MTTVLLALDSSDFSASAVAAVRRQFRPDQARIHLLHVIDPMIYLPLYQTPVRDLERIDVLRTENRKQAEEFVGQVANELRHAGFEVTISIEEGEPRTAIVDAAANLRADLIVLGSHGRRGLSRLLLGSVSEFVARHASCSVEIVRPLPRAA